MTKFWLSFWYTLPAKGPWEFELHSPWWVSGENGEGPPARSICAAVVAESEDAAKEKIYAAFDDPNKINIEWRFCNERPDDWTPFGDRFQRAEWMKWND